MPTLPSTYLLSKKFPLIFKSFDLDVGTWTISVYYLQAIAIVILLFILVWTLARLRHMYVGWSLGNSAISMLFWGFLLTLILEGFFIVGGRTILTEILGWKNAPKPILNVLDAGRNRMVKVLGVTDPVPSSHASDQVTPTQLINIYKLLSTDDAQKVRQTICKP